MYFIYNSEPKIVRYIIVTPYNSETNNTDQDCPLTIVNKMIEKCIIGKKCRDLTYIFKYSVGISVPKMKSSWYKNFSFHY